jgi:lysophospholipase L1-like esterase
MKKVLRTVVINYVILCALLVGVELACQLLYFARYGHVLFWDFVTIHAVQSKVFEVHPYLVGRPRASVSVRSKNKTITITKDHTRWTGSQQEDGRLIRVAILGGSSAFGTGVADEESWPALLQSILGERFAVINYGVPGYTTAEAIIQMALIVPEKRPHIVVLYEGWNDLSNYHRAELGADYYGHGMRQYENLDLPVFQRKEDVFATVRLISAIKGMITGGQKSVVEPSAEPDPLVDRIYVRNLKNLKLLAENMDAVVVFVPQVLYEPSLKGDVGSRPWTKYLVSDALPGLMERFNSHLQEVCSAGDGQCVVLRDVTKARWHCDDFLDEGHFSGTGGRKFAEMVAQGIRSRLAGERLR